MTNVLDHVILRHSVIGDSPFPLVRGSADLPMLTSPSERGLG